MTTIDLFSEQSNILFFGYPGSGTALSLVKIAAKLVVQREKDIKIICCDNYHVMKRQQLEQYARLMAVEYAFKNTEEIKKLEYENCLIYLQGFSEAKKFEDYKTFFYNKNLKTVFTLDCSRSREINAELVAVMQQMKVDAVIPSKLDMLRDKADLENYLSAIQIPVCFLCYGERASHDGCFPADADFDRMFRPVQFGNKNESALIPKIIKLFKGGWKIEEIAEVMHLSIEEIRSIYDCENT
jgi:flagellar biosynthesis GTPase FlhF